MFTYTKSHITPTITHKPGFTEYAFPTVYSDPVAENQTVYVQVYTPKKRPLSGDILFLHGIGDQNIRFLSWLPRIFAARGFRTSMVILPYHEKRKPDEIPSGDPFYSADPDLCVVRFHNTVKDVRQSIDLMESFEGFNPERLWLAGMSFGGMIGTMTLGLDRRIKKGALIITGGNWRWINFHCPYTHKIREEYRTQGNAYGCDSEATCIRRYRQDPVGWVRREVQTAEDIFDKAPIPCYQYDPISFAPLIDCPILFIRGAFDRVIPHQATRDLISLLPNPKVITYPMGHKTSLFFIGLIVRQVLQFFKEPL